MPTTIPIVDSLRERHMPTTKCFALVTFVGAAALLAARGVAADTLSAQLADGRAVSGTVDQRTDADYLWLRRSADTFDLVSGYSWDQVLEGRIEGQTLSTSQLKTWSSTRKQAGRKFAELTPRPGSDIDLVDVAPQADRARAVKTLLIDAELAQWDNDAQADGLRIFIAPLDAQGRLLPVDGHIEFTLVVEREHTGRAERYAERPEFQEGDRLTFQVKKEHFGSGMAFYELPFSRWHPDFVLALAPQGLLHARLSIPGQGVFEASDARVCLREPSRFRDQLQYYSPSRYLPLENASRDGH